MDLIKNLDAKSTKESLPSFGVGDSVDVEVLIREGEKERTQIFSGVVISIKGGGVQKAFTVRRIVQGEGVERVFPFHSPRVANVTVTKMGQVRRAKLYYLRGRTGKAARITERRPTVTPGTKKKSRKKAAAAPPTEEAPPTEDTGEEIPEGTSQKE